MAARRAAAAAPLDWASFARRAPDAELLRYLESGDLSLAAPLSAISPRCKDAAFFSAAAKALAARGAFDKGVWNWAVRHGDEAALRQLLPAMELVQNLGVPVVTPLVTTGDAAGDAGYADWREFWPWINAYCRPIPEEGEPRSAAMGPLSGDGPFRALREARPESGGEQTIARRPRAWQTGSQNTAITLQCRAARKACRQGAACRTASSREPHHAYGPRSPIPPRL